MNGFHIEHILSNNNKNLALFEKDEERFEAERNRLGGVLLLKGRDNISSSNENYSKKLNSYAKTLHWNETLREDSYKSKKDFDSFIVRSGLQFTALKSFGPEELESRQNLLFEIASRLWITSNSADATLE